MRYIPIINCIVQSSKDIIYVNFQIISYYTNDGSQTSLEVIIKDNIAVFDSNEALDDDIDNFHNIAIFITSESKIIQSSLLILSLLVLILIN